MTPPHGPMARAGSRSRCTQTHLSDTATARQRVANGLGLRSALGDAPSAGAGTGGRPGRAQSGRWVRLAQFTSSCGTDRQHRGQCCDQTAASRQKCRRQRTCTGCCCYEQQQRELFEGSHGEAGQSKRRAGDVADLWERSRGSVKEERGYRQANEPNGGDVPVALFMGWEYRLRETLHRGID